MTIVAPVRHSRMPAAFPASSRSRKKSAESSEMKTGLVATMSEARLAEMVFIPRKKKTL